MRNAPACRIGRALKVRQVPIAYGTIFDDYNKRIFILKRRADVRKDPGIAHPPSWSASDRSLSGHLVATESCDHMIQNRDSPGFRDHCVDKEQAWKGDLTKSLNMLG